MKSLTKGLIKISNGKDSLFYLAKFICTEQRSQVVGTLITAQ